MIKQSKGKLDNIYAEMDEKDDGIVWEGYNDHEVRAFNMEDHYNQVYNFLPHWEEVKEEENVSENLHRPSQEHD